MLEGYILCKSLKLLLPTPDPQLLLPLDWGMISNYSLIQGIQALGLNFAVFFLICRKQEILWLGFFSIFLFSLTNFSVNFNICYSLLANKMSPAGRPQKEWITGKHMLMLNSKLMVFSPMVQFNNSKKTKKSSVALNVYETLKDRRMHWGMR